MLLNSRVPLIEVKLSGRTVDTVMLDCGAGGFLICRKNIQSFTNGGSLDLLGRGRGILSLGAAGLEKFFLKYRVRIPGLLLERAGFPMS